MNELRINTCIIILRTYVPTYSDMIPKKDLAARVVSNIILAKKHTFMVIFRELTLLLLCVIVYNMSDDVES